MSEIVALKLELDAVRKERDEARAAEEVLEESNRKCLKRIKEMSSELEAANAVLKPLMKTIMVKNLCPACLECMIPTNQYEWTCKCSPNRVISIG